MAILLYCLPTRSNTTIKQFNNIKKLQTVLSLCRLIEGRLRGKSGQQRATTPSN